MNIGQAILVVNLKFGVDISFWAPETIFRLESLDLPYPKTRLAISVLVTNEIPFKRRVDGVVLDNWLSKKNFGNIANDCVDVLTCLHDIDKIEEWQIKLIEIFKSMM